MRDEIEARMRDLARRAGLGRLPTNALWAAMAVFGLAVAFAAWRWWPRAEASASASGAGSAAQTGAAAPSSGGASGAEGGSKGAAGGAGGEVAGESAVATVCVHMVGAVRHPGLYSLRQGARIADAIAAAGGLLGNAAQSGVNLARPVADGEQIAVPTMDEVARGGASSSGGSAAGGATANGSAAGPVDINSADAALLDTLPGVGPSTAEKIVADREANGRFDSVDDLGRVSGIGPKKLEQLKAYICAR